MLCKMKKMKKKTTKRYANISQTKYCTGKDDKITQREKVKNKKKKTRPTSKNKVLNWPHDNGGRLKRKCVGGCRCDHSRVRNARRLRGCQILWLLMRVLL